MSWRHAGLATLLAALAVPAAAADDGPRVLRGAVAGSKARARAVEVDLRDLPRAAEWEPGDAIKEIPRRAYPPSAKPAAAQRAPFQDPLLAQQEAAIATSLDAAFSSTLLNFNGQGFSGVNPPDTVGDVGPNHYVQMINRSGGASFTVYDKAGGLLAGPVMLDSLGTAECASGLGDPIVLYDSLADRWVLSEFSNAGNRLCVYVSRTSNPVTGGWWAYSFQAPTFPDYPKYGVWPDAYYVGTNEGTGSPVYALDRVRMLNGQPASSQRFTAPDMAGFGFQLVQPADLDGATPPPAGAPGIFMRHRDDEVHNPGANDPGADFLEIWEFHVDWTTPANSTFTGPTNVAMAEIDSNLCGLTSFACVPQPGSTTTLDPLREPVMFRVQYRNFGTHQSLVGNLVTDVGTNRHAIRWFEVRRTGAGAWNAAQQGTYSPDATNRWMGSAAMDQQGNLAVGYSVSSSTVAPGIRYAGRLSGDPAGSLPQGENAVVGGTAANASNRWGDYAALSVDPADDCTFWLTTMYSPSSSWATRIASFKFDSCGGAPPPPDFAVSASPGAVSIAQGAAGGTTVSVASLNAFSAAVTLSASGLPSGVTASFSANPVTPPAGGGASSTLTFSASPSAATGTFTVTVAGVSGALTRTATVGLTVTAAGGGGVQTAVFDAGLQAPRCSTVGSGCDTGTALVLGRDGRGPEPNQPNTIADACADGTSGTFHVDESVDRVRVVTTDGGNFAPGKTVRIEATVWAWTTPSADKLDLYYAANAGSPAWVFVATLTPTVAGSQVLSATYVLPSGSVQAVRAQFRYQGTASACTAGGYNDRDDVVFAVNGGGPPPAPVDLVATFSTASQAPRCGSNGKSCDSGPALLRGRAGLGPEPNQPNTVADSCADGGSGTFHSDESVDRVKVSTTDGTGFAPGKTVRVDVTVWAWSGYTSDHLDLYYAANASAPAWTPIATNITPPAAGAQVISRTYTLPSGPLQAVRARFRYNGSVAACGTGAYDDHDDLVFAVP